MLRLSERFENHPEFSKMKTFKDAKKVGLEECVLDNESRITEYPCDKRPLYKKYDGEKGRAVFAGNVCAKCPAFNRYSDSKQGGNYVISYDLKSLRLRERPSCVRFHPTADFWRPYHH